MKFLAGYALALSVAFIGVQAATPTSSSLNPLETGYCQAKRNECQGSGDPNEALCASEYAACQGCEKQFNKCRGSGDPNEAACAAQMYKCAAKAFPASSATVSTTTRAASSTVKATSTTATASSNSVLAPLETGYCKTKRNECQGSGDPNEALCASEYAACQACVKKYNKCRGSGDPNEAYCASQMVSCAAKVFPASSTTSSIPTSPSTTDTGVASLTKPGVQTSIEQSTSAATSAGLSSTTGITVTSAATTAPEPTSTSTTPPYVGAAGTVHAQGILAFGGLAALLIL